MSDSGPISEHAGESILVVEDSPTQAEKLRYILEKHHYRVAVADRGSTALARIAEEKPALIISDILMPEMDGYELCRRIKSHDGSRDIPVILLTSLSDPQGVIRGLACGADNFITKPYNESLLLSRVRDMLDNRHLEQEPSPQPGLEISFACQKYLITSGRRQILDLLLSTYEAAIHKNNELIMARDELHGINEQLEKRVAERTADLAKMVQTLQIEIEERITIEQSLKNETAERLKTVETLREKEQLLIQQSRQAAMGEMIGNIAHQWRQPLNTLGLTVQQLLLIYDFGEFNREFLAKGVGKSMELVQHMSKTIDDFRNYFQPDKEKVDFNLYKTIEKTLALLEGSFNSQQIQIVIDAKDDPVVSGYPNEFSQVLLNILINARDVIVERKIDKPEILITLYCEGNRAVVTISDNAGGIPEEIIDKIFDPYFTTKGPQGGTGVGLFMSKNIIEKNMGGRLSARNTSAGAEFRITV